MPGVNEPLRLRLGLGLVLVLLTFIYKTNRNLFSQPFCRMLNTAETVQQWTYICYFQCHSEGSWDRSLHSYWTCNLIERSAGCTSLHAPRCIHDCSSRFFSLSGCFLSLRGRQGGGWGGCEPLIYFAESAAMARDGNICCAVLLRGNRSKCGWTGPPGDRKNPAGLPREYCSVYVWWWISSIRCAVMVYKWMPIADFVFSYQLCLFVIVESSPYFVS